MALPIELVITPASMSVLIQARSTKALRIFNKNLIMCMVKDKNYNLGIMNPAIILTVVAIQTIYHLQFSNLITLSLSFSTTHSSALSISSFSTLPTVLVAISLTSKINLSTSVAILIKRSWSFVAFSIRICVKIKYYSSHNYIF